MAVRIITYDLKKEPSKHDYTGFYAYIKRHSSARLSESSYAIKTEESPTAIYNALKPHIDANDWLLILTLTQPYYGQNTSETVNWLVANL